MPVSKGAKMARGSGKISKKEFIDRFTKIVSDHLATMPLEEQRARLSAAERRLSIACCDKHPTTRGVGETDPIRLSARGRREEH